MAAGLDWNAVVGLRSGALMAFAVDLDAAGLEVVGLKVVGLEAVGLEASGFEPGSHCCCSGSGFP